MTKRYQITTNRVKIEIDLPIAMLKDIAKRSKEQGRNINTEIILRLQRSLTPDPAIAAEDRALKAFMKKS